VERRSPWRDVADSVVVSFGLQPIRYQISRLRGIERQQPSLSSKILSHGHRAVGGAGVPAARVERCTSVEVERKRYP